MQQLGPVAGVSVSRLDAPVAVVTTLPDNAPALIVERDATGRGMALLAGPRTRALYHPGEPGPSCVQLRLRPGQAVLPRGRSLRDLADRVVSLPFPLPGELIALSELLAEPTGADGAGRVVEAELLDRVEQALHPWLVPTGARDQARSDLATAAIRLLSSGAESGEPASGRAPAGARVTAIAHRLHVSERQLRNVFDRAIGVSPKQFARVGRVRSVLVHAPQEGLARAASHAGYYDQAHMSAEFRRVMGVPPGAFLAGDRPAPATCRSGAGSSEGRAVNG